MKNRETPNAVFTKKVLISLASIGSVLIATIILGWRANGVVNTKANAEDVNLIDRRLYIVESSLVSKEEFRKLERKVDRLLIRNGINPELIQ